MNVSLNNLESSLPKAKSRANNFGLLRLFFASLVIVSHSPELVDGDRSREILTRLFGTLSFGEIAVDGFFLISGFLIVKSFVESRSLTSYFLKRLFRIVPGYLVCFWACVLILAPLVGAKRELFTAGPIARLVGKTVFLLQPYVDGAFHGLHYELLDGPMWTIAYEFRCYIAAALLGLIGLYNPRFRLLILFLTLGFIVLNASDYFSGVSLRGDRVLGTLERNVRFLSIFLVGAIYFIFRDRIRFTNLGALIAVTSLIPMFFFHLTAEAAFAVFGGYLIFWFAFKVPVLRLGLIGQDNDISYGVYLYAWPIQSSIVWCNPSINPWVLCLLSMVGAAIFGYASWMIVERPALGWLRTRLVPLPAGQKA
jgi:peptidoglycan/LPS O-acetylase OafA/YrhL